MKKIKLKEKDLKNIVSILLEQNEDEYIKVSPERYLDIMKYAGYYATGVAKLPEFQGKKIWITGNLNLSNTPTKSLDGVYYIDGILDISNTEISNIDHVQVMGYIRDHNSPIEKKRLAKMRKEKISDAQSRREIDEWNLNDNPEDEEALAANAILEYLVENEDEEKRTPEDAKRLEELENILANLEQKKSEYEAQGKSTTDIITDIDVANVEIDEINEKIDVYDLVPMKYDHFGLLMFEVVDSNNQSNLEGYEFCAGTPEEMEKAAYEYGEQMIKDQGLDGFNEHFVKSHIDTDDVVEYFREHYEYDVSESPDSYFNEDDYAVSEEQEKRIDEIDNEIAELELRQNNIEDEVEEPEEISKLYDQIQEQIDKLEEEKESIEPDFGSPTDDMIDEKVEELLDDVRSDPLSALKNIGIEDITRFVNIDELIKDMVSQDGVGIINSYDGDYTIVYVNGIEYYVMRIG